MKYLSAITNSIAYKTVMQDVAQDRLSHAYLIMCYDTELIKAFYMGCAYGILCEKGGCHSCATCTKITNHNHADVRHIKPVDGKELKVEDIKELIESTQVSSIENTNKKLYFIYNGERMNIAAQNKLLKTLEEPPRGVTIFIASNSEYSILDTIKSRTRKLYIDSLSKGSIYRELSSSYGEGEETLRAANSSCGIISIGERLLSDDDYRISYDSVWSLMLDLESSRNIANYLDMPFLSKEKLKDTLDIMQMVLRDTIAYNAGNAIWAEHRLQDLEKLANKFTLQAVVGIMDAINSAKAKIESYCNYLNIIDNLLFTILEVRHKCRK